MQYFKETQLNYPLLDHATAYEIKPRNQRKPTRLEQTFVLSFAYYESLVYETLEYHASRCLREAGLRVYYEPIVNRDNAMWLILIMDLEVNQEAALDFARLLAQNYQSESLIKAKQSNTETEALTLVPLFYQHLERSKQDLANGILTREEAFRAFFESCKKEVDDYEVQNDQM